MTESGGGAILKPGELNKVLAVGAAPGAAMYFPARDGHYVFRFQQEDSEA